MNAPDPRDSSALLPWYLNGTLGDEERRGVEVLLSTSRTAEDELTMWRAVQLEVRTEAAPEVGSEMGWRRIRRQLPSSSRRPWWLMVAAASVLLVAGLQTAVLLRGGLEVYQPLSQTQTTDEWRFHVRFTDRTTLAELNELLRRHDARIVEGPSGLGLYTVALPRPEGVDPEAVLAPLKAEPGVIDATVAP